MPPIYELGDLGAKHAGVFVNGRNLHSGATKDEAMATAKGYGNQGEDIFVVYYDGANLISADAARRLLASGVNASTVEALHRVDDVF